jgi:hypothetical protein
MTVWAVHDGFCHMLLDNLTTMVVINGDEGCGIMLIQT